MPRDVSPRKIFITAGEPSGDALGARLIRAIKTQAGGEIVFSGVGGPLMEAEGLRSLFSMRELSVMGIVEVLPKIGNLLRRISQTADAIIAEAPDLVITIDSPDFSFRVASQVRRKAANAPQMIHYAAPTVWAWRPERAQKVAALYDSMLCLYPFEPPYFERAGMAAVFVGHPVLESGIIKADGKTLREKLGIPAEARVVGLLFGSRMGELNRVGPQLREAALALARADKSAHILAPTFPHLEKQVVNLLEGLPCKRHVLTDPALKWDAFAAMDMALATSGTVGLELAAAGVPHLIAYRMNALTWRIVKRKVTVKYAHLANILLDAPVVPEFIQQTNGADIIATARDLFENEALREKQREAFGRVRIMLAGSDGKESPSAQAARFVLGRMKQKV